MSWPKLRLALAALLFLVWSIWLAWQAFNKPSPILVSEPQLLAAPLVVKAEVKAGPANAPRDAVVQQVFKGDGFVPADKTLHIMDLSPSTGPGAYLLALQPMDARQARFLLVPIPVSPGFYYKDEKEVKRPVYPFTAAVENQARAILRAN